MSSGPEDLRGEVARAARVLSALGLVTAYGHVSARAGSAMLITPAADLATVDGAAVIEVPLTAAVLPPRVPAEASPIWRSTAPAATRARSPRPSPPGPLPRRPSPRRCPRCTARPPGSARPSRCTTARSCCARLTLADRAASSLREGEALLLRGNGALTLAPTRIAVARMWLLSAACDVFLAGRPAGPVQPLSAAEITSWRAVQDELLPRLWQHLSRRAGEEP